MARGAFGNAFSKRYALALGLAIAIGGTGSIVWAGSSKMLDHTVEAPRNTQPSTASSSKAEHESTERTPEQPASSAATTRVTVNGTDIAVPANGEANVSLPQEGGQTDISVQSRNQTSTEGSNSSTSISVFSSTKTQRSSQ
jgi:cytoskeletal protein RodZ